jgi:hypothetical protein
MPDPPAGRGLGFSITPPPRVSAFDPALTEDDPGRRGVGTRHPLVLHAFPRLNPQIQVRVTTNCGSRGPVHRLGERSVADSRMPFPDWLLERHRRAEQALVSVLTTSYLLGVSGSCPRGRARWARWVRARYGPGRRPVRRRRPVR